MNILITGISKGLGKEIGLRLVKDGHTVCGIARSPTTTMAQWELPGRSNFIYKQCDIRDSEKINHCLEDLKASGFIPDAVILCAGVMTDDLVNGRFIYNTFRDVFETNLFPNIFIVNRCMEIFTENKEIIFIGISSLCSHRALVIDKIAYPASKAALNMAFESFRIQFFDSKFRFVIVNLGRLGDRNSLIQISYKKAAKKVAAAVKHPRPVINCPFLVAYITKFSRILPYILIGKSLRKLKRYKRISGEGAR